MSCPVVYCDFNATSPLRPSVKAVMQEALDHFGNPSSIHMLGRQARGYVERTREALARLICAQAEDIVFTSGGSEANNTILKHYRHRGARIFVSAVEHASVLQAAPEAVRLPVDTEGVVNVQHLEAQLIQTRQDFTGPILVAIMYANNETGVIQPINELASIAKCYGAHVHCDAVQALGKLPLDYTQLGVDSLSFSAHKIGGPKGVGAYVARPWLKIEPLIHGGGQERGNRSGTENVVGIAGFGAAVEACAFDDWERIAGLRDAFEFQLKEQVPGSAIHGGQAPRLQNTSCFSLSSIPRPTQAFAFDLEQVYVGSGSACSSGKLQPSHVLEAMGSQAHQALHAMRVSLGWSSTESDVKRLVEVCENIYAKNLKKELCYA